MLRIIIVVIIIALGWCFYTGKINLNFNNLKEDSIEKLQNEKTIKAINSTRERRQDDVNKVNNNDY